MLTLLRRWAPASGLDLASLLLAVEAALTGRSGRTGRTSYGDRFKCFADQLCESGSGQAAVLQL